ncbi:unnamed protein product [Protopolystoma xenopodis]|uniref:Uncharacterized protein n=1 Tax=Protopolystoma xenopodis TaxID=117903 RepID=A0A3S5CCZ0_9PLAT|nr:unnamed protein product [Protopolystoma xenopodis]
MLQNGEFEPVVSPVCLHDSQNDLTLSCGCTCAVELQPVHGAVHMPACRDNGLEAMCPAGGDERCRELAK